MNEKKGKQTYKKYKTMQINNNNKDQSYHLEVTTTTTFK
jgi:hypothetical protein